MTREETAVKVEEQLQLARIQIAQMKDEIAELTSTPDWTAREKELNEPSSTGRLSISTRVCQS